MLRNPIPAYARGALACIALVLAASPAHALPLISELFYDAAGSDDGLSFVELYGDPGAPLDGLTIEVVNGSNGSVVETVSLTGAIPADGIFVVADESGGSTSVANADLVLDFDVQNGPDSIVLRDGASVLDALGFGSFDAGEVFAGEGSPAPDAPAGSSLARLFADVDTDDNAADFGVLADPTPGSAPLLGVPEPSVALLLAPVLALPTLRRRRIPRQD